MLTKNILITIQARLRGTITGVDSENIYITPDINYIPIHVTLPCIGIKDGGITWNVKLSDTNGKKTSIYKITIGVYSDLIRDENASMGDDSLGELGTLETCKNIIDAIDNLIPDGCYESYTTSVSPTETFDGEGDRIHRQQISHELLALEFRGK